MKTRDLCNHHEKGNKKVLETNDGLTTDLCFIICCLWLSISTIVNMIPSAVFSEGHSI